MKNKPCPLCKGFGYREANETDAGNAIVEGDRVHKASGYSYPGIVVAKFTNLKGEYRFVVECTAEGCEGMLHIFNRDQLVKDDE